MSEWCAGPDDESPCSKDKPKEPTCSQDNFECTNRE